MDSTVLEDEGDDWKDRSERPALLDSDTGGEPAIASGVLYRAARQMLDRGLGENDSAFTPGRPVWTASVAADLKARFADAPLLGSGTFVDKLCVKLGGAPGETVLLAVELFYLHLLAPSNISGSTKRSLLAEVLRIVPEPVEIPKELDKPLDGGIAHVGRSYLSRRDHQFTFLIRFVDAWKALPTEEQIAALNDPWLFRNVVDSVPIDSAYAQRFALLHLAFPTTFEAILSQKHRKTILAVFGSLLDSQTGDEDRDLVAIREKLEVAAGGPIDYYHGELTEKWHTSNDTAKPPLETLPAATKELAQRLFVDQSWLDETIELLGEKRQLVLYGPPGTGKTYLAQELAMHITEQTGGSYRLVQFHPSYAYEDFFEGFRPKQGSTQGTINFSLEPGPFKLLAQEAAENPSRAFVLVIDEINRANLAKVFGELYFLLEYRDRAVNLQYSPTEEFRLPSNVFLIGTMNTADRSIALVDAAMRRRFVWQGLFPDEPPVSRVLRGWLAHHRLGARPAELLEELNERIADREVKVGPSYLMTPSVATDAGLRRIWKHQILPLLEERHIGDGINVTATYGVDALARERAMTSIEDLDDPVEETGEPLR